MGESIVSIRKEPGTIAHTDVSKTESEREGMSENQRLQPKPIELSEGSSVLISESTSTTGDASLHDMKYGSEGGSLVFNKEDQTRMVARTDLNQDESRMNEEVPVLSNEGIPTVTELDLQKRLAKETSIHTDLSRNAVPDPSHPSLEGFFDWFEEKAMRGNFAGLVDRTLDSQQGFLRRFLRMPIGSATMGQPLNRMTCCNNTELGKCPHAAADHLACMKCHLVAYCSKNCCDAHYPSHNQDTCNPLELRQVDFRFDLQEEVLKNFRKPQGTNEDHADAVALNPVLPFYGLLDDLDTAKDVFLIDGGAEQSSADTSFRNSSNKDKGTSSSSQDSFHGCLFPDEMHLLFPALYDLRNLFQTVRNIPDDYTGSITLFLNCAQAELAVRDLLILELLRYYGAAAIDLAIGLWYSTAMTTAQDTHLMLTILRMLDTWKSSLSATGDQRPSVTYKQPFPHSTKGSSLRADFGKKIWSKLRELVSNDACNRREYKPEHHYPWIWSKDDTFKASACRPSHLASWSTFKKQGFLLPYAAPKDFLKTPNRLRYSWKSNQVARYRNDPASGWGVTLALRRGVCSLDFYGLLFFQLRELMESFLHKTTQCCVHLRLTQFETRKLCQMLKISGMKFHRIDACALYHDKKISYEQALQWCGGLLAKDASPGWPSLLLTATLREWVGSEAVCEAYEKGLEAKKRLSTTGQVPRPYSKSFWNFVEPVTVWAYIRLFEPEDFMVLNSDEETGIDKTQGHVAAKFQLHKQRRHRILSPIAAVPLKHSWNKPALAARFYVTGDSFPYHNLVFSGFTFQERFHEWGWDPGH